MKPIIWDPLFAFFDVRAFVNCLFSKPLNRLHVDWIKLVRKSPTTFPREMNVQLSSALQVNERLGRQISIAENIENFEVLVQKVVPVITNRRTFKAAWYWVAVAVGNWNGHMGIGEHVEKTELIATTKAEKAIQNILKLVVTRP